ncbi:hypothetical protein ACFJGW_15105 [Burkholderiaceae bacterium UC74_6]
MSLVQILSAIAGLVASVIGLLAITMRRNVVRGAVAGEGKQVLASWRAAATGCVALVVAALLFASASGVFHLD